MRTLFAALLFGPALALAPAASAEPPSSFSVPRVDRLDEPALDAGELVLPADVVARPGETPTEALARALHADDDAATREGKPE